MRLSPDTRAVVILVSIHLTVLVSLYLYTVASSRAQAAATPTPEAKVSAKQATAPPRSATPTIEATPTATPRTRVVAQAATQAAPTSSPLPTATVSAVLTPVSTPLPAAATAVPTASTRPSPSATASPTRTSAELADRSASRPTMEPTVKAAVSRPAALLDALSRQEAALRTGELAATLDVGGQRSTAEVLFDMASSEPRLHVLTTYLSESGRRSIERVTVGDQSWQRSVGVAWAPVPEEEGVLGRLHEYLPGSASATGVRLVKEDSRTPTIGWYDKSRDADVTVQLDVATGVPKQLTRTTRGTRSTLGVTYTGWNTSVEITPPD